MSPSAAMSVPADNYIIIRDAGEAERLEVQHDYVMSCQGYYLHPDIQLPASGARIADFGTGTGIFIRELAPAHPTAECHGFDISDKMFPPPSELPANLKLHTANIKEPFESRWLGYFDVVHLRFLEAAMTIEDWTNVVRNMVTLLKPGGWLQWVEDERAHSVRHAARPVAPSNAAKESLSAPAGSSRFVPPRLTYLDRLNRVIMPNQKSDEMTYGYMNLDTLMKDPKIGDLEDVGCDVFVVDREDDGGKLRRDWAVMGIAAVWNMLKSYEEAGQKLSDISREELSEGFMKDVAMGGHFLTRVGVFTGRKKA